MFFIIVNFYNSDTIFCCSLSSCYFVNPALRHFQARFNCINQSNQSKTPKIHTIESHVMDYIKLTGKPLGSLDQCIESVHQYFDQRMNSSKYKVKEKSSDVAGDKLLKLVLHFNAYNLFNWFNKSHVLPDKMTRCHKRFNFVRLI